MLKFLFFVDLVEFISNLELLMNLDMGKVSKNDIEEESNKFVIIDNEISRIEYLCENFLEGKNKDNFLNEVFF